MLVMATEHVGELTLRSGWRVSYLELAAIGIVC